jgi:predicted transcriptional regulator
MQTLAKPLSSAEIIYLHTLLSNASQSFRQKISINSLETRLSKFGVFKLPALRYLISLHLQLSSQKNITQNPTLLAQAESKIISLLGLSQASNVKQLPVLSLKCLIGEMLVTLGLISSEQLNQAIAEQNATNRRLGEILIKKKWLTFDQLDQILTAQVDIRIDRDEAETQIGFVLISKQTAFDIRFE